MKRRTSLSFAVAALGVVCCLGLASIAFGQNAKAPAATPDTPDAQEPEVVALEDIGARADAVKKRLGEIIEKLPAGIWRQGLEQSLIEIQTEIAEQDTRLRGSLSRQSLREFTSLEALWGGIDAKLTAFETELREHIHEFEDWIGELGEQLELWKRTQAALRRENAPVALRDRVAKTLTALAETERRIERDRNLAIDIEGRIAEQRKAVETVHDRIDTVRRAFVASLFVRQAPPLWKTSLSSENLRKNLTELAESLDVTRTDIVAYAKSHRDRLIVHALLIVALFMAIRRAQSALAEGAAAPAQRTEEAELRRADEPALAHPWAAALLMGLSVNTFLQPASPAGFRMSVAIVSVPVALRVLRTLLPAGLTIVLYGFAVLAVSDLVRLLVAELELLSRVLQVTELAVAFAAVIWLRRSQRFEELVGHTIWLRLVRGWLHLAALGLGAGVLATSLGYMYLANRLSLGIIWGSWFALLLFAAVRIAEAVLTSIVSAGTFDRVRMIRRHPDLFLALARRGLRGVATITWVYILLRAGFLWEPVRDRIAAALSTELGYATMTFSLGSMLAFVLTLWASWLLARLLSFTLNEEVFPRVRMPPGVPFALATFARYTVLVIGFVAAIGMLGFSLDRVTLLLSALGVGIGFGLQNVVNNFVSGVMLLFERPIRVGDRVELEGLLGDVTSIGIRASKVRTFDGADVIVPNADFISARVTNWTLADRKRRLIMPVGVAYGTNPRRVIEILERVAKSHPEILPHPEPVAVFRGFGDSSLDFEIRAWTESDRGWIAVQSDLAVATNDAFAEAGIEIPFPQRDLHLKSVAPEVRQEVRPEVSPVAADTSETEPLPMPRRRSGE